MARGYKDHFGNAVRNFERTIRNNKKEAAAREPKILTLKEQLEEEAARKKAAEKITKKVEKKEERLVTGKFIKRNGKNIVLK